MDKKISIFKYKMDKRTLLILLLAALGILLMLFSMSDGSDESSSDTSLSSYKKNLERELSELCSSVSGAGKCKVSVSFSEGERAEYRGTNKISSAPPKILGITILSEGADRSDVRSALTECMTAMFDIGSNRVAVLKMK